MSLPLTVKNAFDNWMQDYRDCGRDAVNELVTKNLVKELAPDPRQEFMEFAMEEIVGVLPFGEGILKVHKVLVIDSSIGDPPAGEDVAKFQEYGRRVLNNYKKRFRDSLIRKANTDWDKTTANGSLDEYLFMRDWFTKIFKRSYCDVDDDQSDLELKANKVTDDIKKKWKNSYAKFKEELKRREKEEERRRARSNRGKGRTGGEGGPPSRRKDGAGGNGGGGAGGGRA